MSTSTGNPVDYDDPLEQISTPALTWPTIGTTYTGTVIEPPKATQARDYESGEPAFWPDGNPKMAVVTVLEVNGERRGLWANRPSAMFAALGEAQRKAGKRIEEGGTVTVTFVGEKPNEKNPKLHPIKQFEVSYEPPKPGAAGDPLASAAGAAKSDEPPF